MSKASNQAKADAQKAKKVIKMYNKKGIQYNPGSPNPRTPKGAPQVTRKRK